MRVCHQIFLYCIMASDPLKLQPVDSVSESSESPEAIAFCLCVFWRFAPCLALAPCNSSSSPDACILWHRGICANFLHFDLATCCYVPSSKSKCASFEIRLYISGVCQMSDVLETFWSLLTVSLSRRNLKANRSRLCQKLQLPKEKQNQKQVPPRSVNTIQSGGWGAGHLHGQVSSLAYYIDGLDRKITMVLISGQKKSDNGHTPMLFVR